MGRSPMISCASNRIRGLKSPVFLSSLNRSKKMPRLRAFALTWDARHALDARCVSATYEGQTARAI